MEETKTPAAEPASDQPAPGGKPVIHRVCEACNNMFPTHPGETARRCPHCRKD
ncbi:MAG: hypothetical protein ACE5HL_05575 [Terriglobia bacterium]